MIGYLLRILTLLLLAGIAVVLAVVPSAHATAVSYVDGGEVWIASLDGTRRVRLTQPGVLGEGQWRTTAMADHGRVAAQRREGGSMFTSFGLWSGDGQLLNSSALPYEPGWTTYSVPIGFDLTDDGEWLVYGYSNTRGIVPNAVFGMGHYIIHAETTRSLLTPYEQSGQQWPSVAGKRVVATDADRLVSVQDADGAPPHQPAFTPWINVDGWEVNRADVAANGSAVGIEVDQWSGGTRVAARILMVKVSGLGGALGDDCFLPVAGLAGDVSLSQDGTHVAWKDDEGVKVAGIPAFNGPATCELTAPPVLISATGASPSIGGMDVNVLLPPPPPPPPPPGGPGVGRGSGGDTGGTGGRAGPGSGSGSGAGGHSRSGSRPQLRLALPPGARAAALARGLRVTVTLPRAGSVTLTGSVPARLLRPRARGTLVVARGSASARRAGRVVVTLKATRAARGRLGRLAGRTLVLAASAGRARGSARLPLR